MYSFYNIDDLLLTYKMKSLNIAVDNGYEVVIPDVRLKTYSPKVQRQIEAIEKLGLVQVVEQPDDWIEYLETYESGFTHLGKSLICLYHFCRTKNAILVVEQEKKIVMQSVGFFGVATTTLMDFHKDTIREERFLNFIMELRQQEITK